MERSSAVVERPAGVERAAAPVERPASIERAAAPVERPAPVDTRYRPLLTDGDATLDEHGLPVDPARQPVFGGDSTPDRVHEGPAGLDALEQAIMDRSVALPCGRSYLPHGDRMDDGFTLTSTVTAKIEPLEGFYTVIGHGTGEYIELGGPARYHYLADGEAFARFMRNDPTWDGEAGILLLSCYNGKAFLDDLYDALDGQVTIVGCREAIAILDDGDFVPYRVAGYDRRGNPILEEAPDTWVIRERRSDGSGSDDPTGDERGTDG